MRWIGLLVGLALAGYASFVVLAQASSGAQPWSSELSDNFILAKLVPFALGIGVVAGLLHGAARPERRGDGAVRRFSTWTVVMHVVITLGVLITLPTGMFQYLGGVLNLPPPVPLYWIYRVHYVGALIVLLAVAAFVTAWWYSGDRSLLVPRGAWKTHIRGFVAELPPFVARIVAPILRVDLRSHPPAATGRFTFYETAFSFPTWAFAIGLITVTGLIKALRYVYEVDGTILWWSSTLHVAAMVLIALKTLDHLRYSLEHWPLVGAIFTGWLGPSGRPGPASVTPASAPAGIGGDGES
jgi:hypothetical protein